MYDLEMSDPLIEAGEKGLRLRWNDSRLRIVPKRRIASIESQSVTT
jgi:hypothetical protein